MIFIDSAEKTFLKKVPKTDKTDPKRLKKDLPKLVKGIGPDDQVNIFATKFCWCVIKLWWFGLLKLLRI